VSVVSSRWVQAADLSPIGPNQCSLTESAGLPPARVVGWIPVGAVVGLMVAEGARDGGFWPSDALAVALASTVLLAVQLIARRIERRAALALTALIALALWWLIRAIGSGTPTSFLPFGASVLGFSASLAVVQPLSESSKQHMAVVIGGIGAAVAVVGFAGLTERWFPMAMPAQGLWRLSSTLTYSDAAGLLLVLSLLLGLGLNESKWLSRAIVCLCLAGAIAAQSRGALVALACGLPLVPLLRFRRFAVPLASGVAAGVVAVGTSSRATFTPVVGLVITGALVFSVFAKPRPEGRSRRLVPRRRAHQVAIGSVVLVVACSAGLFLRHEIELRALAPSDQDRSVEWSAAIRQFEDAPLVGVGPDRILVFRAIDGTWAHFAHNEYLQVGADTGVVGLGLLALSAIAIGTTVRRRDVASSCAVGALVAFAVGGAVDFDWHLPMIALVGGCVAGLSIATDKERT
jgi:O-antigen ligase